MNLNTTHFEVFYFEVGNRKLLRGRPNGIIDTGKSVWMLQLDHLWLTAESTVLMMISRLYNMILVSFVLSETL